VGGGDEADEEAALADGGVPDEQDLEGAVVAARGRRGHASNRSLDRIAGKAKRGTRECGGGWVGAGRWPSADRNKGSEEGGRGKAKQNAKAKAKRGGEEAGGVRWTPPFGYG